MMGISHEHIHFETSTVLIRQYPIEMVTKPNGWIYAPFESLLKLILLNLKKLLNYLIFFLTRK
jgi:hypothetical protein